MTDWVGICLTVGISLFIVFIIWSKVQGDTILDILRDIREFMREG